MGVHEARKVVTAVFCDLAESTALAEARDPEAVRGVLSRYYECVRDVLEQHGATVEKFIGDAVVGVFGVPVMREDDAVRAIRSADAILAAIVALNLDLQRDFGVRLAVRVGVNTGTVLGRDGSEKEGMAFGDAVNVAARLQQAAASGEVLVAERTLQLAGDVVRVAPIDPVVVKGKSAPAHAARLVEVMVEVPAFERPISSAFVGRDTEVRRMTACLAETQDGMPYTVTVVGPPGIGKSRLIREFITRAGGGGTPLVGRCLPYGDGITYWPLAEMVRQVDRRDGGVASVVGGDPDAELVFSRLDAVRGSAATATPGEIAWATRRLLEHLAADGPLIVVFDDIHWAEPAMLDLIEYLGSMMQGPVLIACAARRELLDTRPTWATPRARNEVFALDELSDSEIRRLLRGTCDDDALVNRVVERAAGNPLFVEQLLAAVRDGSFSADTVPASISVLLGSRVDQLSHAERAVLGSAAVEGRLFHRGALEALVEPGPSQVDAALLSLVRKEFIRPDRSEFPGDDGYRFVHALVRDAAYNATPKALRAELHVRYADWLECQVSAETNEVEEILAYHLEQSCRFREELGPVDGRARQIALRAARHLATAATRANDRWDSAAVQHLLDRARPLFGAEPGWLDVAVMYASALWDRATPEQAIAELAATIDQAERADRPDIAWRARLLRSMIRASDLDNLRGEAERALDEAGPDGDPSTLTAAWRNLAFRALTAGDSTACQTASVRCIEIARHAGLPKMVSAGLNFYAPAITMGPTPAGEGVRRFHEQLADESLMTVDRAILNAALAALYGMRCDISEMTRCISEVSSLQERRGETIAQGGLANMIGPSLVWNDDLRGAERLLRASCADLRAHGLTGVLSTTVAYLGHVVLDSAGRPDDAESLCQESKQLTDPGDVTSEVLWRTLRARLLTLGGAPQSGLAYARAAVEIAAATDWPNITADALVVLATVAAAGGETAESTHALRQAIHLYRLKQNLAGEYRARRQVPEPPA